MSEMHAPVDGPAVSDQPQSAEPETSFDASPETTGDEAVDAVVSSLRALDGLPVSEHVAVFERAHESLRQVLSGAAEPVRVPQG